MKYFIPFLLIAFVACNKNPQVQPTQVEENTATYTKTMMYAVDLNSVFHEDLNDEDFSDVAPITQQLIADVLNGKLQAYDAISDQVITAEQVKAQLAFTDTIWFEEPETGDQSIDIVERDFTTDFYGLTFKEQWTYNTQGSIVERKIVALAPRVPVYSSQGGELRGYTSAFWVKYD